MARLSPWARVSRGPAAPGGGGERRGAAQHSRAELAQFRDASLTDRAKAVRSCRLPSTGWWLGAGRPFPAEWWLRLATAACSGAWVPPSHFSQDQPLLASSPSRAPRCRAQRVSDHSPAWCSPSHRAASSGLSPELLVAAHRPPAAGASVELRNPRQLDASAGRQAVPRRRPEATGRNSLVGGAHTVGSCAVASAT